jgi:hypothetical protein
MNGSKEKQNGFQLISGQRGLQSSKAESESNDEVN